MSETAGLALLARTQCDSDMSEQKCGSYAVKERRLPTFSPGSERTWHWTWPDGAIELRAQLLSDVTRVCNTMDDHQRLLEEAREFCDPATGEVINRIPDELIIAGYAKPNWLVASTAFRANAQWPVRRGSCSSTLKYVIGCSRSVAYRLRPARKRALCFSV